MASDPHKDSKVVPFSAGDEVTFNDGHAQVGVVFSLYYDSVAGDYLVTVKSKSYSGFVSDSPVKSFFAQLPASELILKR